MRPWRSLRYPRRRPCARNEERIQTQRMLVCAYDGSLNGDWVVHYAVRFAATTPERRLRLRSVLPGFPEFLPKTTR